MTSGDRSRCDPPTPIVLHVTHSLSRVTESLSRYIHAGFSLLRYHREERKKY